MSMNKNLSLVGLLSLAVGACGTTSGLSAEQLAITMVAQTAAASVLANTATPEVVAPTDTPGPTPSPTLDVAAIPIAYGEKILGTLGADRTITYVFTGVEMENVTVLMDTLGLVRRPFLTLTDRNGNLLDEAVGAKTATARPGDKKGWTWTGSCPWCWDREVQQKYKPIYHFIASFTKYGLPYSGAYYIEAKMDGPGDFQLQVNLRQ